MRSRYLVDGASVVAVALFLGWVLSLATTRVKNWFVMTDELYYERLAVSVAQTGSLLPRLHGELVSNVNQLYPVLISPLFGDGNIPASFAGAHRLNAFLITSAAIPVYLLARRIGLGRLLSLWAGALSVAVPWVALASFLLTEVVAYPAFCWALLALTHAVARKTWQTDLLALGRDRCRRARADAVRRPPRRARGRGRRRGDAGRDAARGAGQPLADTAPLRRPVRCSAARRPRRDRDRQGLAAARLLLGHGRERAHRSRALPAGVRARGVACARPRDSALHRRSRAGSSTASARRRPSPSAPSRSSAVRRSCSSRFRLPRSTSASGPGSSRIATSSTSCPWSWSASLRRSGRGSGPAGGRSSSRRQSRRSGSRPHRSPCTRSSTSTRRSRFSTTSCSSWRRRRAGRTCCWCLRRSSLRRRSCLRSRSCPGAPRRSRWPSSRRWRCRSRRSTRSTACSRSTAPTVSRSRSTRVSSSAGSTATWARPGA